MTVTDDGRDGCYLALNDGHYVTDDSPSLGDDGSPGRIPSRSRWRSKGGGGTGLDCTHCEPLVCLFLFCICVSALCAVPGERRP